MGDDWMVLDYATRGISGPLHLGLADDRGQLYTPMGGGASGDHTKVLRHHTAFREALHPAATELALTLVDAKPGGRILLETSVPISERVTAAELRASSEVESGLGAPPSDVCAECGRPTKGWQCDECRREGHALAARRSRRLVPEVIAPTPGELDLVPGMRHAVAGLLLWEEMFMLRFVFVPTRRAEHGLRPQMPGPILGRWSAEDASGRTFRGRSEGWGRCESEGRVLGDATIGFMPVLDLSAGPLLVRTESAGRVLTEVELPLDGPTQVVGSP